MVMFCMGGVFEDADKLYEDGDYSKAIKMWQRSCDDRDTRSCYRLGGLYKFGINTTQSYQKASEVYKKTCDGGDMTGCYELAGLYFEGYGVRQDYQKAASLHQKACDGGRAASCLILGDLYKEGNYQKAVSLYQSGLNLLKNTCENGDADSCDYLGDLYKNGWHIKQDRSLAKEFYGKACDLADQIGCDEYKQLNEAELINDKHGIAPIAP